MSRIAKSNNDATSYNESPRYTHTLRNEPTWFCFSSSDTVDQIKYNNDDDVGVGGGDNRFNGHLYSSLIIHFARHFEVRGRHLYITVVVRRLYAIGIW